jgi:protein-tyrosine phosphatase
MLRRVSLDRVPGTLFLHSMPGRLEPFEQAKGAIIRNNIRQVICLTSDFEIEERSPDYAQAIAAGLPWRHVSHPVSDFGVPDDALAFKLLAGDVATSLKKGENVLVHCAAGIGRTGTFAVAVLCQLGYNLADARQLVHDAGSSAESQGQVEFLQRICR